jgi:hypothetical protein
VHAEDVVCNLPVPGLVDVVGDDEEEVESGEQRVREGDVLVRVFVRVVLDRVHCRQLWNLI